MYYNVLHITHTRVSCALRELTGPKAKMLERGSLEQVYLKVMRSGVTDPRTGTHYKTEVSKTRAHGFTICDTCDNLQKEIAAARTPELKESYTRKLATHHREVKEDRIELARVARLCKLDDRHVGIMIDAVDKQKFQLPTTARQSKSLKKLNRVVQKITGVQWCDALLRQHTCPHMHDHRHRHMRSQPHLHC